jgi:DNA polymerase-3 subunit delta
MFIKQANLSFKPPETLPSVYFLLGQDEFQINTFVTTIREAWQQSREDAAEIQRISLLTANDWALLETEAFSYSLFSNSKFLDARYDKKTWDATGKAFLETFLQQKDPHCLVIFRTPGLTVNQLKSYTNTKLVHIIQAIKPDALTIKQWILHNFKELKIECDPELPDLIYLYTQDNLLACSQLIEKLKLLVEPGSYLSLEIVQEQLTNQSNHSLYDLAAACLEGDANKVALLLQQACYDKTEPTLILWILAQEIRLLIQLLYLKQGNINFQEAATKLKIWTSKVKIYQKAINKYELPYLKKLLQSCNELDKTIKSNHNKQIWHAFENLAFSLCGGDRP